MDLRVLVLCQLFQIPNIEILVRFPRRDHYLKRVCGPEEKAPTEAHFSQIRREAEPRASA